MGHTVIVKNCARLIDRPVYQHSFEQLNELLAVGYSARIGAEAVVIGQVGPADRFTHPLVEPVTACRNNEMAIVRPKRLIRSEVRVGTSQWIDMQGELRLEQ